MGEPRPSTPTARHHHFAAGAAPRGGGDVPLASEDPPRGDAGRDEGAAAAGALHDRLAAAPADSAGHSGPEWPATGWPEVFDTAHASELYPELAPLAGWWWSWVGEGTTAQLVGYHVVGVGSAVDVLYIDSDIRAAVTRTAVSGELSVHQSGDLVAVLALLATGGAGAS